MLGCLDFFEIKRLNKNNSQIESHLIESQSSFSITRSTFHSNWNQFLKFYPYLHFYFLWIMFRFLFRRGKLSALKISIQQPDFLLWVNYWSLVPREIGLSISHKQFLCGLLIEFSVSNIKWLWKLISLAYKSNLKSVTHFDFKNKVANTHTHTSEYNKIIL